MTVKDIKRLENFFLSSFEKENCFRELRLSDQEVDYIKKNFPSIYVKKCENTDCPDGKSWWEISFTNSYKKI